MTRAFAFSFEPDERDHLVDVARLRVVAGEHRVRLADGEVRPELGRLEDDADPLPEVAAGPLGIVSEHPHLAAVALAVALEDLDRRRLAGAVRAEEPEDLARLDREVDPAHRLEVPVRLPQAADLDCRHRPISLDGMATFRYVVADVFTDVPLAGNQVAVFTDAREIPEEQLQPLAREMKLSETVFVYPPSAEGNVRIRIFTPALELPFAGHPILGTAFVLARAAAARGDPARVRRGRRAGALERDGSRIAFGWMTQPPFSHEPYPDADALLAAARRRGASAGRALPPRPAACLSSSSRRPRWSPRLRPDFGALETLSPYGTACIARDGDAWKARVFVPAHGVPEDPATGSAAGPIALHLARHGRTEFGQEIEIHQGAEIDRPRTLYAVARSETEIEVGGIGRRRRARRVPAREARRRHRRLLGRQDDAREELAARLGVPHIELDALHHDPGWTEASAEVLQARVDAAHGRRAGRLGRRRELPRQARPLVLERADTLVLLDLPYRTALRRVTLADVSPRSQPRGALEREPRVATYHVLARVDRPRG